ncbi:Streptomonomicin precursor peptide protein [Streptomonospora alba]|uniref:Streptomonomicin peptide protein n=1 Tax=Streptomonospora alba TaxID=183763 RepID=A0A0C2JEQ8_9ACTN|nr:lasso peptide streptomonomicin [Streptomonospora alba]KIH99826.1 Streptomonomicin precursor peptide protein [Streptomonospora alba]
MSAYEIPTLTRIGKFKDVTKSLGSSPYNDILGYPALIVIYP